MTDAHTPTPELVLHKQPMEFMIDGSCRYSIQKGFDVILLFDTVGDELTAEQVFHAIRAHTAMRDALVEAKEDFEMFRDSSSTKQQFKFAGEAIARIEAALSLAAPAGGAKLENPND